MKNNSYSPYVTEHICRFDGSSIGMYYSGSVMHCEQKNPALLHENNIISLHNQLPDTPKLIIIPLMENILTHFLAEPENCFGLKTANVRLAINYAGLLKGGEQL